MYQLAFSTKRKQGHITKLNFCKTVPKITCIVSSYHNPHLNGHNLKILSKVHHLKFKNKHIKSIQYVTWLLRGNM